MRRLSTLVAIAALLGLAVVGTRTSLPTTGGGAALLALVGMGTAWALHGRQP